MYINIDINIIICYTCSGALCAQQREHDAHEYMYLFIYLFIFFLVCIQNIYIYTNIHTYICILI